MRSVKIPVARPLIGEEEKSYVLDALLKGEISGAYGSYLKEFEEKFARFSGCSYGVATTSGTTALHLALLSCGILPGDEIIVPSFTNMATCFAVDYIGARPVPIDIEKDTWNINPALIEEKITPRTRAIIAVHIYGHPADMDAINAIAREHNLIVIEDAAEAHGAEYKGKKAGCLGDIACFSFYANKIITTGEGGMITTNNADYAKRARTLGSLAYGEKQKFMHQAVGFNYRMTNIQAALGCAQLSKIETIIKKKRELADFYNKSLCDVPDLQLPMEKDYAKNVYWMYHVVFQGGLKGRRNEIMAGLEERGIETRESFVPMNRQEIFIKRDMVLPNDCPSASYVSENGFYLPSGPVVSEQERSHVVASLKEIIRCV